MRIKRNSFIFTLTMLAIFFILAIAMNLKFNLVGVSFLINVLSCSILLGLSSKNKINILLFYYLFSLIFMAFVPWINYTNNVIFWTNQQFTDSDYLYTNFIIFLYNCFIIFSYKIIKIDQKNTNIQFDDKPNFLLSIVVCLICFLIVLDSVNFNILRIFFRGLEEDTESYIEGSTNAIQFIMVMLARIVPSVLVLRYLTLKSHYKTIVIFSLLLLCAFPTSIPRFLVAFIYLPLLIVRLTFLKKPINIILLIISSILLVFPFLNQFRYFSTDSKIVFVPSLDFFNQEHFDAYQNFARVIQVDYITYGYQLLGVLFFYVPRQLWPTKPYGSGYQLARDNNYFFNNISMPYIAEGYVNFGFLGMMLFGFVLAYAMKFVDYKYLYNNKINLDYSKGLFYCAAIFFILRGDLLSSFAYLVSGITAFYIAKKV